MITLPPKAAKNFMALRIEAEDTEALLSSSMKRIASLRNALKFNSPEAANIEHEVARLEGNAADYQSKYNAMVQLITQITTAWPPTLKPDMVLADIEKQVEFVPRDNEPVIAAVTRLRSEIVALDNKLRRTNRAEPTRIEKKEAAKHWLDDLAKRTQPKITANKHGKFAVDFSDASSFTTKFDVSAALAYLDSEKFLKKLYAAIDAAPEPELALTAKDKAARVAEIRAQMLELEFQEQAAIDFAAREGISITRRPFANILAVLGLTLKTKESHSAAA